MPSRSQRCFHSVDNPVLLSDEVLAFAVGPLGIFVFDCWDRHHLAVITLPAQPAEKGAFEQIGVEPVGTSNAIERLHEEFKRRIKTQTVLPSAETAAMLFWALLASGQINMRKVDGWQTLATTPLAQPIDLAA